MLLTNMLAFPFSFVRSLPEGLLETDKCCQNVALELAAYGGAHDIDCRCGFHCLRGCLKEATDVDAKVFMQFAYGRACGQA